MMDNSTHKGAEKIYDLVVVGSGFFGLTVARMAAEAGFRVLVIEKRNHIGGNSWSEVEEESGIEIHKYGSHLFHTSQKDVWDFVNRFSKFNSYQHSVLASVGGRVFRLPINLGTVNEFFQVSLSPSSFDEFMETKRAEFYHDKDKHFEGRALSLVGRELYEAFFQGYTLKQWETDPKDLPAEVFSRLPMRSSYNTRYFSDTYEGLPVSGYAGLLEKMSHHSKIKVELGTDFFDWVKRPFSLEGAHLVYSGPIDRYYDFEFGPLSWRTLDFEWEVLEQEDHQGCAVMNFPDASVPYTRIHEFKHLHPERKYTGKTVIAREYSRMANNEDEPFYPVNAASDRVKLNLYRERVAHEKGVTFGGRLGSYQYLDMHMAISSAFSKFRNVILPQLEAGRNNAV
jgi:UDP-galactopyranose mutase